MLCEPAESITDLVLGLAAVALAVLLPPKPARSPHWRRVFLWTGAAALAGAAHHGWVTCSERWAGPSWAVISVMVVVAVSYLLAATVDEVLGPGRGRVFWVLRSAGLVAYAALAVAGRAGVESILICEGLTMLAVLGLWAYAARRRLPLAWPVIAALLASGAAAGARAAPDDVTDLSGLDPVSLYHLAQIPGLVLLALAVAREGRPLAMGAGAPGRLTPG
ncbi:DUF6962 family protein [Miltoncostaea marina]|uniref:DUF6962 family protein n=1 Tax=Miltoncostaea marina TaxID=2843215 RepID=UPI001C3E6A9B|nr:hypothetical protein [Miltoncostaea marina]